MSNQIDNRRIAKNTLFLYIRMISIMLVSLFTSREVLKNLGVEDYGIYSMVGGAVTIFQIVSNSLTDTVQRYLTYEIGKGNERNLNKLFSTSLLFLFILGSLVILIAEPIGLWFLKNKLLIPINRLAASEWIFHFSVISMFMMFVNIPYNALIIAHERMKAFAGISILETLLKLGIAHALLLGGGDKLILYGSLMVLLQIMMRLIYRGYSIKHFQEARFHWCWDKYFIREIGGFASWTLIGSTAYIGVTHGINLLLGMFFLSAVNAARGLAVQVESAVKLFTHNFQTAMNPQITKSYASEQVEEMVSLVFRGARFSSFLLQLPTLPILFETETILRVWLPEVPPYTVDFIRIILIIAWINCLGNTVSTAAKATGNIKQFELYAASIKLWVLPVGYICLRHGFPPQSVFIAYLIFEAIALCCNIYITHRLVSFSLKSYLTDVILPAAKVALIAIVLSAVFRFSIPVPSILRLIIVTASCILSTLTGIYLIGITHAERDVVNNRIIKMIH